jgi:NADPH:quinone reductase-like Zn-dependent oxidoreductase
MRSAAEVLSVEEVPRPVPGEEDVLVHVQAAGVSIGDRPIVTGKPYLVRFSPFGGFPKPTSLSFEAAAAVPWGTTALQGLRDAGGLKAGERVLVYGASGAVGT